MLVAKRGGWKGDETQMDGWTRAMGGDDYLQVSMVKVVVVECWGGWFCCWNDVKQPKRVEPAASLCRYAQFAVAEPGA